MKQVLNEKVVVNSGVFVEAGRIKALAGVHRATVAVTLSEAASMSIRLKVNKKIVNIVFHPQTDYLWLDTIYEFSREEDTLILEVFQNSGHNQEAEAAIIMTTPGVLTRLP